MEQEYAQEQIDPSVLLGGFLGKYADNSLSDLDINEASYIADAVSDDPSAVGMMFGLYPDMAEVLLSPEYIGGSIMDAYYSQVALNDMMTSFNESAEEKDRRENAIADASLGYSGLNPDADPDSSAAAIERFYFG